MAKIKKIQTIEAPEAIGPYSQGTQIGGFVFVSGQLPIDPKNGQLVGGDVKVQTDRVLENMKAILEAGGSNLNQVVRCDVFLKDMKDFKDMNEVYAFKFSADPKPVRQTIQVGKLPLDALVEISCISYKD